MTWRTRLLGASALVGLAAALAWAQMTDTTTILTDFANGLRTSTIAPSQGGPSVTTTALDGSTVVNTRGHRVTMPATQTIAAGGTIAVDSCNGVKRITAAGAVTTSTSNTFTAHGATLSGCRFTLCNVGANTVTLDSNAATLLVGGANVALLANSCIEFVNDGVLFRQTTAQLTAT